MVIFQSNVNVVLNIINNFLGSFYCECTQRNFDMGMHGGPLTTSTMVLIWISKTRATTLHKLHKYNPIKGY
jgi:hypothetical protein